MFRWKFSYAVFMAIIPVLLSVACSLEAVEQESEGLTVPKKSQGRLGLVSVSYDHDWGTSDKNFVLTTTAQFVRFSAMDRDQVARLLALPLDPEKDLPALERCKIYDTGLDALDDSPTELEQPKNVELLEAGDLKIETAEKMVTLVPRHFPWPLPYISGVVYGESHSTLVDQVSQVVASSTGGEAVGAFSVQSVSPSLPRLEKISGQDPDKLLRLRADQDLSLRWVSEAENLSGVATYIELRYAKGKRDLALRCRVRDDGAFDLSRSHLLDLVDTAVVLEMGRIQQTSFAASGIDTGELRIQVRDQVSLQF
jgi:hypothetical protein